MLEHQHCFTVKRMASVFSVSRSGYYRWRKYGDTPSARALYLAVVIDLHSRAVVGWSMSERMTSTLVCDALKMAQIRRGFPKGVILHSDGRSQYCSHVYRTLEEKYQLKLSMSPL